MKTTISFEHYRAKDDYDNKIDIDIRTDQPLTTEEYQTVTSAIESIKAVILPKINNNEPTN